MTQHTQHDLQFLARMNIRYHEVLESRYESWVNWTAFVSLLLSSAAFIALADALPESVLPYKNLLVGGDFEWGGFVVRDAGQIRDPRRSQAAMDRSSGQGASRRGPTAARVGARLSRPERSRAGPGTQAAGSRIRRDLRRHGPATDRPRALTRRPSAFHHPAPSGVFFAR